MIFSRWKGQYCLWNGPTTVFWQFVFVAYFLFLQSVARAVEMDIQELSLIAEEVAVYLAAQQSDASQQTDIRVNPLDPRLRLRACSAPLEVFTPQGQRTVGAAIVAVRCSAPVPWTVHVQATVALIKPVLVTARPLVKGAVIETGSVEYAEQDVSRLNSGYFSELSELDGMLVRRSVNAGVVLHPGLLQNAAAIRRGERVTILGQVAGVEVRMAGQALSDGSKGSLVRVRNLSSGRDIEGEVIGPGLVRVRL